MRLCPRCKAIKPLSAFSKEKCRASGVQTYCRECHSVYYFQNKKRHLEWVKEWYRKHPGKGKEYSRRWKERNPERAKQIQNEFAKRHPEKFAQKSAKRRAISSKATPKWANKFFISEIYDLAKLRTQKLGFEWHVDHIVPLRSPVVCGLHVENNLQVIPAKHNLIKQNHSWPDMP